MFFFFSLIFFLVLSLFLWCDCSSPLFHCSQLLPLILSAMVGFTIFTPQPLLARCGHPSRIAHQPAGCPATTNTLYWLHHTLFPNKNGLSCLLPLFVFTTFIWIRVNLLPYLPLWHASSGSSSYFTSFGWDVISVGHFSLKKFERNPQNRLPLSPHCGHNGKCQSHHLVIWFRNHEYSVLSRNDH